MAPTDEQFAVYRVKLIAAVARINRCIRSGTIPKSPWAVETVRMQRAEQRASRQRQIEASK